MLIDSERIHPRQPASCWSHARAAANSCPQWTWFSNSPVRAPPCPA